MNTESQFSNLHADLIRLLPVDTANRLDPDCFSRYRYDCLELLADLLNKTRLSSNHTVNPFTFPHFDHMCHDDKPQAWVTERAYVVALTMAVLGCVGLTGNIISCVVIAIHLLKFSGTFVLFLFLSVSDSLVVVMQIVDAYRNFVAVSQYTTLDSETELTTIMIHRRDWSCKIFLFFWHFALQLSAWLVMALSVDRYASLKHNQFIRSRPFLYRRAWIIVGSIVTVLFLLNLPFLLFVKSTVIKTHCALNHFCIFGGLDSLWPKSTNLPATNPLFGPTVTGIATVPKVPKEDLEVISIREAVESPTARWISLWLSRQHLFVFGIIPYLITFIFNMILIHYLCSCPANKNVDLAEWVDKPTPRSSIHRIKQTNLRKVSGCASWFPRLNCYNHSSWSVKRKSTATIPLVVINQPRVNRKWEVPSSNHQIQNNSNCKHVTPLQNVQTIICGPEPIGQSAHDANGQDQHPANPCMPATSTLVHDSTNCNSNDCIAKCMHLCDERNVPAKIDGRAEKPMRMNHAAVVQENQPGHLGQSRPVTYSGVRKRTQSSSSGFWIGQKRTTILLLVVTFTFIGLTLPYHIYVELEHDLPLPGFWAYHTLLISTQTFWVMCLPFSYKVPESKLTWFHKVNKGASNHYDAVHAAEDLCRFLLFLNNCMNFIVYMTGRQFRKGFFLVLHRLRQSVLRWITCQPPQTDGRWHRHPPNHHHRRNKHRHMVRDQKKACRIILEANQARPHISIEPPCIIHEPGCPLARQDASVIFSVER